VTHNAEDIHYLHHVTNLGERVQVVTHQPIYSITGVKLIDVGVAIKRDLMDKLSKHHLFPAIDECLTAENSVSSQSLWKDTESLLTVGSNFFSLMTPENRAVVSQAYQALYLPPMIAFKLTVAREERPDIYQHSLEVGLLAAILQSQVPEVAQQSIVDALFTGVFHDMGLLHIDPQIFRKDAPLSEESRHHLYSHPIIGHLILEKLKNIDSAISLAVLQHHERLDGSGYPRGLYADHLGDLGQILAVAELGATLMAQKTSLPMKRLVEVVLRMNADKIHSLYAGYLQSLLNLIPAAQQPDDQAVLKHDILSPLIRLAISLNHWQAIREEALFPEVVEFISERMERLTHALADVGVDLNYWTTYDENLAEDPGILAEIECIGREGSWQLCAITQELRRRWGSYLEQNSASCRLILEWLSATESNKTLN
jgi:HD-GYP domain-containing protein (c-di-GMP phosphodiesterase class II)